MPGYTNIYLTTQVPSNVELSFSETGPGKLGLRLATNLVTPGSKRAKIMVVERLVNGMFSFDVALSIANNYIGSLGGLITGHVIGSDIWFRYRTAEEKVLQWISDRDDYAVTVQVNGHQYTLTITGERAIFGYDDIAIVLSGGQ